MTITTTTTKEKDTARTVLHLFCISLYTHCNVWMLRMDACKYTEIKEKGYKRKMYLKMLKNRL